MLQGAIEGAREGWYVNLLGVPLHIILFYGHLTYRLSVGIHAPVSVYDSAPFK